MFATVRSPTHPRLIIAADDVANFLITRRMLTLLSYGIPEFERKCLRTTIARF